MVMYIHRRNLVVIHSWLTRQVKDEESIAVIFVFNSTLFILVNYYFRVSVAHHFQSSYFLYHDLAMVQFYRGVSRSAKTQYLNYCPWEIIFQMQLFGSNHSVTGAIGITILQICFQHFLPKKLRYLAVLMVSASSLCAICAQVKKAYLFSKLNADKNGPDLKLTSFAVIPSIK